MSATRTAAATAALERYAAERAAENPRKLSKATRTVAVGLCAGLLTVDDLADAARVAAAARAPSSPELIARLRSLMPPVPAVDEAA